MVEKCVRCQEQKRSNNLTKKSFLGSDLVKLKKTQKHFYNKNMFTYMCVMLKMKNKDTHPEY